MINIGKIIIVNGAPTSGKDTFCKLLKGIHEAYGEDNAFCMNVSSIDLYRQFLDKMLSLRDSNISHEDIKKDKAYRNALVELKATLDKWYPNISNEVAFNIIYNHNNTDYYTISTVHIREPENIKAFVNMVDYWNDIYDYDVITVYIDRKASYSDISESDKLGSDSSLYPYDAIIDNNGDMENLISKTSEFYANFIAK